MSALSTLPSGIDPVIVKPSIYDTRMSLEDLKPSLEKMKTISKLIVKVCDHGGLLGRLNGTTIIGANGEQQKYPGKIKLIDGLIERLKDITEGDLEEEEQIRVEMIALAQEVKSFLLDENLNRSVETKYQKSAGNGKKIRTCEAELFLITMTASIQSPTLTS